jgi:hypothetical protein
VFVLSIQNFNDTQRAAFCVYSGIGIHNLRKYLEKIAHSVPKEGYAEEEDSGAVFSSLGENLIYETDEDVQELDEHDFLINGPHPGQYFHHQAQAGSPSMPQPQSEGTQLSASVGNASSTREQSSTSTSSSLHMISRTTANAGTSRQSSRRQRGETRITNLPSSSSVPIAYAGMATADHNMPSNPSNMRHRSSGAVANTAANALMHARLQRVSPRLDEGTSTTPASTATAFDRRRPYQSWVSMNRNMQDTNIANGEANSHLNALETETDHRQAPIVASNLINGHHTSSSRTNPDHSLGTVTPETRTPSTTTLQSQTTHTSSPMLARQSTQTTNLITNHTIGDLAGSSSSGVTSQLGDREGSESHSRRRGSLPLPTSLSITRKESVAKSGRSTPRRSTEVESRGSHDKDDENSSTTSRPTETTNNSSECSTNGGIRTKRGLKGTLSAAENYAASLFKTKGKGRNGRASPNPGMSPSHKQEK